MADQPSKLPGSKNTGSKSRTRTRLDGLAQPPAASVRTAMADTLVFDPLEPRILLNAEVLAVQLATLPNQIANHDLLIQAVNQAEDVGGQIQTVQRVEVLDQSDKGAVLAIGDMSTISSVAITGNAGNDSVTLSLDSFGGHTVPALSFTGGTGQNALVIDHSAATPLTWTVDGNGGGSVTAGTAKLASFQGVQSITGSEADVLAGPSANTNWAVTGPGSGTVSAMAFAGFSHLQGAADNDDTFTISGNGEISGGIDGGAGGFDTVVVDATAQSTLDLSATNSSSGSISVDGQTTDYTGMEPITVSGTAQKVTLDLTAANTQATLSTNSSGQLVLAANTAETHTFSVPPQSLTILLDGSDSTLAVSALPTGYVAPLSIQQGSSASGDTVTFSGDVATGGQALSASADTVTVEANATLDTRAASGTSGAITLDGKTISADSGSKLLADTTLGAAAGGAITLAVSDQTYRAVDLPIDYSDKSVSIDLTGAELSGGNVSLQSADSDLSSASTVPVYVQGFVGNLETIASQIPGEVVSELTGIDASVVLRGADSAITLGSDTIIDSSGTVSIDSQAATSSLVQAIATDISGASSANPVQVAAGYAQSTASATVDITGNSSITAAGDVSVLANGSTDAEANATTSSKVGNSTADQPAAISVAVTYSDLSSTATLESGSSITSTAGSVNFNATGNTTTQPDATTNGYDNGRTGSVAGASAAVGYDNASVLATVNGTITAAGTATPGADATGTVDGFEGNSSSTVNLTNNTIDLPSNGLQSGDQVTYTAGTLADTVAHPGGVVEAATPIGGLTSGQTYYALTDGGDQVQLASAPVLQLDPTGTNPQSTQTLNVVSALDLDIGAINSSNNSIYLAGNGFNTGDLVTYNDHGNTAISGLTNGATYVVNALDGSDFQLETVSTRAVVTIAQGSALGNQSFTDGTNTQSLNLATISGDVITTAGHGLTNGQTVVYRDLAGTGDDIGGLADSTSYTVQVLNATQFELLDTNGQPIALSTPAASGVQEFGYLGQALSFNPTTAVDPTSGEITVASTTGLATGAAVIYNTDPSLDTTTQVPVLNGTTVEPDITVVAPDAAVGGLTAGGIYYLVVVDATHVRLASSAADALAAGPIDLTSLGGGNDDTLAGNTYTDGIGITASLTSSNEAAASPAEGNEKPDLGSGSSLTSGAGVSLASLFPSASAALSSSEAPVTEEGTAVSSNSNSSGLDAAGGVVVNYANHVAKAVVGTTAGAILSTPQSVNIAATIQESEQSDAQASASRPSSENDGDANGDSTALSISLALLTNDAEAIAGPASSIDAGNALSVSSDVEYPLLAAPSDLLGGITSSSDDYGLTPLEQDPLGDIATLLDGTFGVGSQLLNTWTVTSASSSGSGSFSIAGSIGVNIFTNTSDALIQSGSQINRNASLQNAGQTVSVSATTNLQLVEMAGIGGFSLNTSAIKAIKTDGLANALSGGSIVDLFDRSEGSGVGGSILDDNISDTTHAEIAGGAAVHAPGGLTLASNETVFRVAIAQSGALSGGSGATLAFSGSGLGYRQVSTTYAGLDDTGTAGVDLTGGGALLITATTGGLNIGIAGSIVVGQNAATGIGISAAVNDLDRKTAAFIGNDPASAEAAPTAASTIDAGSVSVSASTAGSVVAVAVAGTGSSGSTPASGGSGSTMDPPAEEQSPDDALDGVSLPALFGESEAAASDASSAESEAPSAKSGVAIAGSAAVGVIDDTTLAYVSDTGMLSASGPVTIAADNSQLDLGISGGVAIATSGKGGNTGSKAIAGAFSVNQDTADTEAFLRDVTLTSTDQPAGSTADGVSITATRGGELDSFTASLAGNSTSEGAAFAGSASVNRMVDTTDALVDGADLSQMAGAAGTVAGQIGLSAQDSATVLAIGGGISVTTGSMSTGVGASLGFNQLSAQTHAGVLGTDQRATVDDAGAGLRILAQNDGLIRAVGVSAGVSTDGTGGAFTIGINILSSSPSIFGSGTEDAITATVNNATVDVGGPVSLTAEDGSVIQSVAGALGIGLEGSAFGIGLGWNEVVLNVSATVVDASLTAAGAIGLLAQSTDSNGLVDGKISSAAVSGAVGENTAVGGAVSVNGIMNTIGADIDSTSTVSGTGTVSVAAADSSTINTLVGGAALSLGGAGIGAALGGNYIDNGITAGIEGSATSIGGDVDTTASETAGIQALTVGLAGGDDAGVGGSLSVNVVDNTVKADIGATATVLASVGAVNVTASDSATVGSVAGQVAVGGDAGVGAASTVLDVSDDTEASISGDAVVHGMAGVTIKATNDEDFADFALEGSASGTAAIGGAVTATVIDDTTRAFISPADSSARAGFGVYAGNQADPASTSGDVTVEALDGMTLLGTAGSLSIGGSVGVGVGVDAGVATLDTEATIGAGANVAADGNVVVDADESEDITSISVSGTGGGDVAVGANAGVTDLSLTTAALVDSDAVVTAHDNVVVTAEDDSSTTQVAGSLQAAGYVAVGVAADIGLITKTTTATIASGARVTALALGGGIVANTGAFAAGSNAAPPAATTVTFATSAIGAGGVINASTAGLATGDQVVYQGGNGPLGGLQDGATYYVIVVSATQFKLARSLSDAQNGIAITITAGLSPSTGENQVALLAGVALPSVSSKNYSPVNLSGNPEGAPVTASQGGVVVVAVSTNSFEGVGAAAGAALVAVEVAGAVGVDTIDTEASIAAGATVHSGQSVAVAAGRTDHSLTLGLGGAVGAAAVAPAIAVPVLNGTTSATIGLNAGGSLGTTATSVTAGQDVTVTADAQEDMTLLAIGFSAGGVAIAGSAGAAVVDTTTLAEIGGSETTVKAQGNVLVSATDTTTDHVIAGAVGLGGVAGAGAIAATVLTKTTDAIIDGAMVDGLATTGNTVDGTQGVVVLATSTENVTDVAGSGSGGGTAALAGAVTVEELGSDTLAAIQDGAHVNTLAAAGSGQSVAVYASNTVTELVIAGALGVGGEVGIGAGVDVGILTNQTNADIDDSTVDAVGTVEVNATTGRNIQSDAIAAGVGSVGLGGGVVVEAIGGAFSASYSAQNDSGSTNSGNALAGNSSGTSVLSQMDGSLSGTAGEVGTSTGTLPAIDPATAVSAGSNTIDFGQATGIRTGEALQYSANGGPVIGGLVSGDTYYAIVSGDGSVIQLAYSRAAALSGEAIALTPATSGGSETFTETGVNGSATDGAAAKSVPGGTLTQSATASNPADSTSASIGARSNVSAATVMVDGNQQAGFILTGGGAGIGGLAGVGVGLVVVGIQSNVSATVEAGAAVATGSGGLNVEASRTLDLNALGIAGAASGFVSLGAAVAYVQDSSSVTASMDGSVTGPGPVTVDASHSQTLSLSNTAGAISAGGAVAAAIVLANVSGETVASVGASATIGTVAGPASSVTVSANRSVTVEPYSSGEPFGIGLAAGQLAGAAGVGEVSLGGGVSATIGASAVIDASGAVDVTGTDTPVATGLLVDGGAFGILAAGAMIGSVTATDTAAAGIGNSAKVTAGSILVEAQASPAVSIETMPSAGGIGAGSGSNASSTIDTTVSATVGSSALLLASGAIRIESDASPNGGSQALGTDYGGVSVGFSTASSTETVTNTATVGDSAAITSTSGDVKLLANSSDTISADGEHSGGALVAVAQSSSSATLTDATTATVGGLAAITAAGDLSVESKVAVKGSATASDSSSGAGVDAEDSGTLTIADTANTTVGTDAAGASVLTGNTVEVLADVASVIASSNTNSTAKGAGGKSESTATTDVTSDAYVTLGSAVITGETGTTIAAQQDLPITQTLPTATLEAAAGKTSPTANDSLSMTTNVSAGSGTSIFTRSLTVDANVAAGPIYTAHSQRNSDDIYDAGSSTNNASLTDIRSITWNAAATLLGAPAPTLVVDADGTVHAAGLTATVDQGAGTVTVDPISNTTAVAGTVVFDIAPSAYDGASNVSSTISGTPNVTFDTTLERVSLTNNSDLTLVVGAIGVAEATASGQVSVTAGNKSGFQVTTLTAQPGTPITIDSTATGDVELTGSIQDPLGSVSITAAKGSIVNAGGAAQAIDAAALTLDAGTSAGTATAALNTQVSGTVSATAGTVLALADTGSLSLGSIVAGTEALLSATGSILHGTGTDISAPAIALTAKTGSIGTATAALSVAGGPMLSASAATGITLAAGVAGITLAADAGGSTLPGVQTSTGNITVTVADANASGQDITVADNTTVRAATGAVTLDAGDNVIATPTSTIAAAMTVTIAGNVGDVDNVGAVLAIEGSVTGQSVTLSGSAAEDTILLRQVKAPTTVVGNGGPDTVLVGSNATYTPAATTNTGGTLSGVLAALTVDGSGTAQVDLDDSGDLQTGNGLLANGASGMAVLTGLRMAGSVSLSQVATVTVALGNKGNTFAVSGTPAGTAAVIEGGSGSDAFIVGAASAATAGNIASVAATVAVVGNGGTDTLLVTDSGDATAAPSGALAGGSVLLGGTTVTYAGVPQVTVALGNGTDTGTNEFDVTGSSVATTIDAGTGADTIVFDGDPEALLAPVLAANGKAGTLTVDANFTKATTLTLAAQSATQATLSGGLGSQTAPGSIATLDATAFNVTQAGASPSSLTIDGTAAATTVTEQSAGAVVTVNAAANPLTIDLNAGGTADITGTSAAVTVNGDGAGSTLQLDLSASTTAATGSVTGTSATAGTVSGLTPGAIGFSNLGALDIDLSNTNVDTLTLSEQLAGTAVSVANATGDDSIDVTAVGTGTVMLDGGTGSDTVTLTIVGTPSDEFDAIKYGSGIGTLIVDNTSNTAPVTWTRVDGAALTASQSGAAAVTVTDTAGIGVVDVLGGDGSGSGNGLNVTDDSGADEVGTVDGSTVEVDTGADVLSGAGFGVAQGYGTVITFDGLKANTNSYQSDSFRVSDLTSNFGIDDSVSTAAEVSQDSTLQLVGGGKAFSLASLQLSGTGTATLTGTTVNGGTVSLSVGITGDAFQTVTPGPNFADVTTVSIALAAGMSIDNIAVARFPVASGVPSITPPETVTIAGDIEFDTANGDVYSDNSATVTTSSGTVTLGTDEMSWASAGAGLSVTVPSGTAGTVITTFSVAGNLAFAANDIITGTGANALALNVADNVTVGESVQFNVGATTTTAGPGGGAPGVLGGAGAGGSGGAAGGGGAGGGGGSGGTGEGGGGSSGTNGGNGADGSDGSSGNYGSLGGSGTGGGTGFNDQSGTGGAASTNDAEYTTVDDQFFNDNGGAGSSSVGSGGAATGGAIGNVHNASGGGTGGGGTAGSPGLAGASGSSAGVGVNTPSVAAEISGGSGGAGGAGGSGGQGGGGGGGGAGGGGGGGGGGSGAVDENGGNGGHGGAGGTGGNGGDGKGGTAGGAGGAGGGAFEIVAGGTIASDTAQDSASFSAVGGEGGSVTAAPTTGYNGYPASQAGLNAGLSGGTSESGHLQGGGGNGGSGGLGATGGKGGGGGTGVPGAGGAGGTILLDATDVEAQTFTANADGGLSGSVGTGTSTSQGGVGRVLVESDTVVNGSIDYTGTETGGTASTNPGTVVTNPFVTQGPTLAKQTAVSTPFIAGLEAGADVGGLLAGVTVSVANGTLTVSGATGNAVQAVGVTPDDAVAILRVAVGPGAYDQAYAGYDMLLFVNLSGQTIAAPALSLTGAEGASTPVALTSLGVNGSTAETALSAIGNGQVWATLVPHNETLYVSASVGSSFSGLSGFANGRLSVLTGTSASTTPDAVFLTTVPVATTLPGNVAGFNAVTAVTNVDGTQLYAVNTAQGTLVALNVTTSTSGTTQFTERQLLQDTSDQNASNVKQPQSLTGVVGVAASPDGGSVYTVSSQNIDQFSRTANGIANGQETGGDLTYVNQLFVKNATSIVVTANNEGVFVGGSGGVSVFQRDPSSGNLAQRSTASAVTGVTQMVQSADGSMLYVLGTAGGTAAISTYSVTFTKGTPSLTEVGSPYAVAGATGLTEVNGDLYVANATLGTLTAFSDVSGTITQIGTTQTEGTAGVSGLLGASSLAVSSDGSFVLVTSATENTAAVFQRAADGSLTFVQLAQNAVGGITGLNDPAQIIVAGSQAYVASVGTGGGGGVLNVAGTAAAPNQQVTEFSAMGTLAVTTGPGDNTLAVTAAPPTATRTLDITTGTGSNTVSLDAASRTTNVTLGGAADTLLVATNAATTAGNPTINVSATGTGRDDTIALNSLVRNSTVAINLTQGSGTDLVTAELANIDPTAEITVTGRDSANAGTRNETIIADPGIPGYSGTQPQAYGNRIEVQTSRAEAQIQIQRNSVANLEIVSGPVISFSTAPSATEGSPVTITITASPGVDTAGNPEPLSGPVLLDLAGDGAYGDVPLNESTASDGTVTATASVTPAELALLGLDQAGVYPIDAEVEASDGTQTLTSTATSTLTIGAKTPVISVSPASATAAVPTLGTPFSIDISQTDYGTETVPVYTVDWGDGTTQTFSDTAATLAVTHTYETPVASGAEITVSGTAILAGVSTAVSATEAIGSVGPALNQFTTGGPYTIAQGGSVQLFGSAPGTPATYQWQVNGKSDPSLASADPVLTWAVLQTLADNPQVGNATQLRLVVTYAGSTKTFASNQVALTITNVPPVVTIMPPASVALGTAGVLGVTANDPSTRDNQEGFTYVLDVDGVQQQAGRISGSNATTGDTAQIQVPEAALALSGTHAVALTVTDGNKGSTTTDTTITVTPVAPTLTVQQVTPAPASPAAPATVVEGSPFAIGFSAVEPGANTPLAWTVNWGDGTTDALAGTATGDSHVYTITGQYAVSVTETDRDGTYTAPPPASAPTGSPFTVTVTDSPPTLSLQSPLGVDAGGLAQLSGLIGSPDTGDFTLSVTWGDGSKPVSYTLPSGAFTVSHVYADAPTTQAGATDTITAKVTDAAGVPSQEQQTSITIGVVAPVVTGLTFTDAVTEGSPATLLGTVSEVGANDAQTVTVDWGDGSAKTAVAVTPTGTGGSDGQFSITHTYAQSAPTPPGSYTVSVTDTDQAGAVSDAATIGADVLHLPPKITGLTPSSASIDEGGSVTLTGTFTYAGAADTHTAVVAWADGTSSAATVTESNGSGTFTATHTYVNNLPGQADGSYVAVATLTDETGATAVANTPIAVANVAPILAPLTLSHATVATGGTVTVSSVITDPGRDRESVVVQWGDGTQSTAVLSASGRSFTASHTYSAAVPAGSSQVSRQITATVTDQDGTTGTATAQLTQTAPVVSQAAFVAQSFAAETPTAAPLIQVPAAATAATSQPATVTPASSGAPTGDGMAALGTDDAKAAPDDDAASAGIATGTVAMAAVQPDDVIRLVRSGNISMRTSAPEPSPVLPAMAFDDATGDWMPTGLPGPRTVLLTDELGEDWLMLPGMLTPQQAQA